MSTRGGRVSGTWWKRCGAVALADALAFAWTIHVHLHFHRTATGPQVMTAGQVLGWIVSGGLFVVLILTIVSARRAHAWGEYRAHAADADARPEGSAGV